MFRFSKFYRKVTLKIVFYNIHKKTYIVTIDTYYLTNYLGRNYGIPFIIFFTIMLLISAIYLALGLENIAIDMAMYSYYSLALGILFQFVCYLKFRRKIKLSKKLKKTRMKLFLTVIILMYFIVNIYVTYFQEKILLVGDWPHPYFSHDYWAPNKKYIWAPSLGFVRLNNFYSFDKVYILIDIQTIESSQLNIDEIVKLSKNSKELYFIGEEKQIKYFCEKYNIHNCRIFQIRP